MLQDQLESSKQNLPFADEEMQQFHAGFVQ